MSGKPPRDSLKTCPGLELSQCVHHCQQLWEALLPQPVDAGEFELLIGTALRLRGGGVCNCGGRDEHDQVWQVVTPTPLNWRATACTTSPATNNTPTAPGLVCLTV